MKKKSVAILKFGAIGDILMTLPLYYSLVDIFGSNKVIWIVGQKYRRFLTEVIPGVRYVEFNSDALFGKKILSALWQIIHVNYNILRIGASSVYVLHKSPLYSLLAISNIFRTKKLGQKRNGRMSFVSGRHQSYTMFEFVHGYEYSISNYVKYRERAKNSLLSISRSVDFLDDNYVVLCPGYAPSPGSEKLSRRTLDVKKWCEIADFYKAHNFKVYILGSASERDLFSEYFDHSEMLCGILNFSQIITCFKNAHKVISTDNGLLHLAYSISANLVAIMGPTPVATFLPIDFDVDNILQSPLPCVPCYDGKRTALCSKNSCISDIDFSVVLENHL